MGHVACGVGDMMERVVPSYLFNAARRALRGRCACGYTVYLGNMRSTVTTDKGCPACRGDRSRLNHPVLNAVGGRVFQRKTRARTCACGHVAAPDLPGGVSVPSPLRGPDSIWGSGTPCGVRGPRLFWLIAPFSGTRGVTRPFSSKGRVRGR